MSNPYENDAQFKCPQCGNDREFVADSVIVYNGHVSITRDGWDIEAGDMDLSDNTSLTCCQCRYSGHHSEFAL